MCGRYALHSRPEVIALAFGLSEIPASVVPRFNIAPAADVLVVRAGPDGTRVPATLRWGLLPHWAKDPKLAAKLNNARGELFAFAGLWERWEGGGGPLETCAIVTTDANAPMQVVHDRMPVILAVQDYARWLDCSPGADVADLLVPCPPDAIRMYPVSTAVNRASNDLPELIQPLEQA